jgi:thiol-disulfide isomerase/thioredoxin/protocatechuate 3,4-dioxygenase beta subunit
LHGTLLDEKGHPVAGAEIGISGWGRQAYGAWVPFKLGSKSDSKGMFKLEGAPALPSSQFPVPIALHLANGHFAYAILTSNFGTAEVQDHPVSCRFRVTTSDGVAVTGARITVDSLFVPKVAEDRSRLLYSGDVEGLGASRKVATDKDGVAMIDGLPGGVLSRLSVHKPGMARFTAFIDLPAAGEVRQNATLVKGITLAGKVLAGGKPVAGIRVSASALDGTRYLNYDSVTGPDGMYRIDECPQGATSISAIPESPKVDLAGQNLPLPSLTSGQELDGLNFVLQRPVLIKGQVRTAETDRPVAAASVCISSRTEITCTLVTDSNGQFEAKVSPGTQYVQVQGVNGKDIDDKPQSVVTVDAQHSPPITLRVSDVLLFPSIPHLTGKVFDLEGKPVSSATVVDIESETTATTDDSGLFRFSAETRPGESIVVTKADMVSKSPVVLSDKSSVNLRLDATLATFEGRVVGEDGKPVPGTELTLSGKGALGSRRVISDGEGRYRFDKIAPGYGGLYIWATKSGFGNATIQGISSEPGRTVALEPMKMVIADGTIDGVVLDPNGRPASHAKVSGPYGVPDVVTGDDGLFHLTQVPRTKVFLEANSGENSTQMTMANWDQKGVVLKLLPPKPPAPGSVSEDVIGQLAPPFKVGQWLDGKPINLASLRGKIVVLDFWAVSCPPCVASLPRVQALADTYRSQGVVVIGVHEVGLPIAKLRSFVSQRNLTYPIGLDLPDATGLGATAYEYAPKGWPTVYVIAPNGRVFAQSNQIEDAEKAVKILLAKAR